MTITAEPVPGPSLPPRGQKRQQLARHGQELLRHARRSSGSRCRFPRQRCPAGPGHRTHPPDDAIRHHRRPQGPAAPRAPPHAAPPRSRSTSWSSTATAGTLQPGSSSGRVSSGSGTSPSASRHHRDDHRRDRRFSAADRQRPDSCTWTSSSPSQPAAGPSRSTPSHVTSLVNAQLAIGIVNIPVYARVKGALRARRSGAGFVAASRALGESRAGSCAGGSCPTR